jgi:AcrR family transcriptional regulator
VHVTEPKTQIRRDAERNRQRLLVAATEVFAEQGLAATLHDVAARAGLSAPTAYRNWANKQELIDELFEQRLHEVAVMAERALKDPDPWNGLTEFLEHSLRLQLEDRGLSELLHNPEMGLERLDRSRDRLAPMINAIADRAKQAGSLRPDAEGTDLVWIQVALTALMDRTRRQAPNLYRRYLTMLLDSLRAHPRPVSALPVAALTTEETHAIITSR